MKADRSSAPPWPLVARRRLTPEVTILDHLVYGGLLCDPRSAEGQAGRAICERALDTWLGLGLPFDTARDGGRRFDETEVLTWLKWSGQTGRDPFWASVWIMSSRWLIFDQAGVAMRPGSPPPPAAAQRYGVALRRDFHLDGAPRGARLRLRLPVPLAGPDHPDIVVTPIPPPGFSGPLSMEDGRLAVLATAGETGLLSLGAEIDVTMGERVGNGAPLVPEEADLALRPNEGPIRVTPRIHALAAALAGDRRAWDAINAFWRYMVETFLIGPAPYDGPHEAALDLVLDTGWCDCHLSACLMIALCRARGIPARLISGLLPHPFYPSPHSWCEVWTAGRGWSPVDTFGAELSAGGQDEAWRDHFIGRIDARLVFERPPKRFSGRPGLPLPSVTSSYFLASAGGVLITTTFDPATGALLYSDHLRVRRAGEPDGALRKLEREHVRRKSRRFRGPTVL